MFYRCAHSAQMSGRYADMLFRSGTFFSFFVLFLEFGSLWFCRSLIIGWWNKIKLTWWSSVLRLPSAINRHWNTNATHAHRHRICIDNTNAVALSLYLLLFRCYRLVVGQFQVSIEHSSVCRRCLAFRCWCWWWVFFSRVCFYTIPLLALLCTTCTTAITVSWILALVQLISSSCAISFSSHVAFQAEIQDSANNSPSKKKNKRKNSEKIKNISISFIIE